MAAWVKNLNLNLINDYTQAHILSDEFLWN